jgi:quinol monooxygenase YgiN
MFSLIKSAAKIAVLTMLLPFSSSFAADDVCNENEVGYVATFEVKPGSEIALEAALSDLAKAVNRLEPGVVLYAPFKGADGQYYMMERYQDEAARKVHASSDEVRALFGPLMNTLVGPPDVKPVSAVCS